MNESEYTTCPCCHEAYYGKHQNRCACTRARDSKRARKFTADHPGYYSKYDTANCYEHTCEWQPCGIVSKTHKQEQRYCSPEHYRLAQAEAKRSRLLPILHPNPAPYSWLPVNHPAVLMQQRQVKRLFIGGTCARDGVAFVAHAESGVARYCSLRCAKATSKDTRRARKRGAGHEPHRRIDIFERDGWRCQIAGCVAPGRKTRRDVHWSHPLAPTIDHLIPLSKGGADAPYNVACAHRQCNSIKSDTGGAQLRLVG